MPLAYNCGACMLSLLYFSEKEQLKKKKQQLLQGHSRTSTCLPQGSLLWCGIDARPEVAFLVLVVTELLLLMPSHWRLLSLAHPRSLHCSLIFILSHSSRALLSYYAARHSQQERSVVLWCLKVSVQNTSKNTTKKVVSFWLLLSLLLLSALVTVLLLLLLQLLQLWDKVCKALFLSGITAL